MNSILRMKRMIICCSGILLDIGDCIGRVQIPFKNPGPNHRPYLVQSAIFYTIEHITTQSLLRDANFAPKGLGNTFHHSFNIQGTWICLQETTESPVYVETVFGIPNEAPL